MSEKGLCSAFSIHSRTASIHPTPVDKLGGTARMDILSDVDVHELSRRVTWKCDLRLVPALCLLYFTAFLDRTNVANASIEGFPADLGLPKNGYNTTLWIFFIPFVLFEVPLNLFMNWQKVKPNRWLGGMMFLLGCVSMCQGLTKSAGGLYACRFIMGLLEGSFAPGAALLMGQYYRKHEFGLRFACFFNCALLGSACSAFLAYAIDHMDGVGGYSRWRWIFILEGLFSVVFSILAFLIIPGFPAECTFLSPTEKAHLLQRIEAERGNEKITFRSIKWRNCLFDWKVWLATLIYFCGDMSSSSNVSFSPTILKQLGWTSSEAQIHQIPIYLCAIFISLTTSYWFGRLKVRYPFVIGAACVSLVGWAIQLSQVNPPAIRYFALFTLSAGASTVMPMSVVWLNNNIIGRPEKAVAAAIQMGFGNSANFVSSNVFITDEAPRYPTAFKTGLALAIVGVAAAILYPLLLRRENELMDQREADGIADGGEDGGEKEIRFRYAL